MEILGLFQYLFTEQYTIVKNARGGEQTSSSFQYRATVPQKMLKPTFNFCEKRSIIPERSVGAGVGTTWREVYDTEARGSANLRASKNSRW